MADWPGWLTTAAQSGAGGLAIWGVIEIIKTIANRQVTAATAADRLSDSALDLVRQARDDAQAAWGEARTARQDADSARRDASEARREATEARREAMDMARDMRRIRTAILSPYATLDGLRAMVSDPPSSNGTSTAPV